MCIWQYSSLKAYFRGKVGKWPKDCKAAGKNQSCSRYAEPTADETSLGFDEWAFSSTYGATQLHLT